MGRLSKLLFGAEARNRVDKHISVGAPFLSAEKLAYVYDTGDALDLFASIDEWLIGNQIKSIMPNITAIYSLLPMETYFTPYLQIKNSAGVITTQISFSSTINVLSTQLNGWNSTLYNSTKNHQSLLFVNGSHITQLVDSYYIVGNGESTPEMLQITLDASNQKNGDVAISSYSTNGDGTVSLHSALINGTINSHLLVKYGSSTVDADHVKLITGEDDEKTFDYICDVINGVDVYAYSDSTFFNKYSGYKEIQ